MTKFRAEHVTDTAGRCLFCNMTHEERLDFSMIACSDAESVGLPTAHWQSDNGAEDLKCRQRGVMLDGLAWRAKRWETAMAASRASAESADAILPGVLTYRV